MVLLRHDPRGPGGCRRLTPGTALPRLWSETARGGRAGWEVALRVVRELPVAELATCSIAQAQEAFAALLDSTVGPPPPAARAT